MCEIVVKMKVTAQKKMRQSRRRCGETQKAILLHLNIYAPQIHVIKSEKIIDKSHIVNLFPNTHRC